MADIISLDAATRRTGKAQPSGRPIDGPAQLLFFTGVRYERRDMETQKKSRKRKTAPEAVDAAIGS